MAVAIMIEDSVPIVVAGVSLLLIVWTILSALYPIPLPPMGRFVVWLDRVLPGSPRITLQFKLEQEAVVLAPGQTEI